LFFSGGFGKNEIGTNFFGRLTLPDQAANNLRRNHHYTMNAQKMKLTGRNSDRGQFSRRKFIQGAAIGSAAIAFPYVGNVLGANDKISVACIGVGGKGDGDSSHAARCGGNLIALCDVDQNTLNNKAQKFPGAKLFSDYRKMLQEMEKSIDAVTVSVPDHNHGLAAAMALGMGKHVYCQKPLTQTIYEARVLRDLASRKKLATQMGNQGSAENGLRRAVEVVHAGLIGPVSELHVWSNRPIWPQGIDRPSGQDPVPANLDWENWIGPAPMRPFKNHVYHDFKWRGWLDFGTGALGDMACHTVNMPFRALKLGYPTVVEYEDSSQVFSETYPATSRIRFEFPEREGLPPVKFWWYDGNPDPKSPYSDKSKPALRPNGEVTKEISDMLGNMPSSGALLVGEKGKLFSPDDYGAQSFIMLSGEPGYTSLNKHEAAKAVPQTIPRADHIGEQKSNDVDFIQKQEWFRMMREGTPAYSNFEIASRLVEIILLGVVALRVGVGKRMEWDGPKMHSPNCPEAARFVKRNNRAGWTA
jgi:hypothetical protein